MKGTSILRTMYISLYIFVLIHTDWKVKARQNKTKRTFCQGCKHLLFINNKSFFLSWRGIISHKMCAHCNQMLLCSCTSNWWVFFADSFASRISKYFRQLCMWMCIFLHRFISSCWLGSHCIYVNIPAAYHSMIQLSLQNVSYFCLQANLKALKIHILPKTHNYPLMVKVIVQIIIVFRV